MDSRDRLKQSVHEPQPPRALLWDKLQGGAIGLPVHLFIANLETKSHPCNISQEGPIGSLRHSYPMAYPRLSRKTRSLTNTFKETSSKCYKLSGRRRSCWALSVLSARPLSGAASGPSTVLSSWLWDESAVAKSPHPVGVSGKEGVRPAWPPTLVIGL